MNILIEKKKTRQFGSLNLIGIHVRKPNARELADAISSAERDGFQVVYVYDTGRELTALADMVSQETGIQIGWSDFCQTIDAFWIRA